jgi:hypothetical protein
LITGNNLILNNTKNKKTMKKFMLIFRNEKPGHAGMTEEQMQATMLEWRNWISNVGKKGKFEGTNRLFPTGKTVQSNKTVTDGPYAEIKEYIGGYLIVKTSKIEEAIDIAKDCPIFKTGGNVEVREVMEIDSDYNSDNFLMEKVLEKN